MVGRLSAHSGVPRLVGRHTGLCTPRVVGRHTGLCTPLYYPGMYTLWYTFLYYTPGMHPMYTAECRMSAVPLTVCARSE